APAFWLADILWVLLASGEQTGGRFSLLWGLCAQGSGPAPHTQDQDQQVGVLEGNLTFRVGDQLLVATAGSFLFIPRGTVHTYRVDSPTATILTWYTPAGFERFITELGVPAKTRTLPPPGLASAVTDTRHLLKVFAQAGAHWVDEPDALRPAREWGDPTQASDLSGRLPPP
ncbi:MAG TPA: cupin domain-containing protein, partial [Ktedonobacterales bacterium]|nr:cupin domain-containing protein [Ktedonobacterales bacterium]